MTTDDQCTINGCTNNVRAKGLCNRHYFRLRRHGTTNAPTYRREELKKTGKSYCPKCNQTKPLQEFTADKHTFTGVAIYCKSCHRTKGKIRYKTHKNEHIDNRLKKMFGISLSEYNTLLNQQDNRCAICGKNSTENKKMLAVDHNHDTKKIRGLLCSTCNQGIGLFHDSPEQLTNAIKYLTDG